MTPKQRALIRLDRLLRRGFPYHFNVRVRRARARIEATMELPEMRRSDEIIGSERRAGRYLFKL